MGNSGGGIKHIDYGMSTIQSKQTLYRKNSITMKHTSLLMVPALVASVVCACSHDDQPSVATSNKEIRFNVTVPRAARAATTTASIDHFRIFSFVDSKPYMHNVTANKVNTSWVTTPVMYWPADDSPVNFYCISPMIREATSSEVPNPNIEDYEDKDGTTDLLYSVASGVTTNPVSINFRHALSKLAFNLKRKEASASQSALKVEVKELSITDIRTAGNFTYPSQTTSANSESAGTWHDQKNTSEIPIFKGTTATLTDSYTNLNSTGYEFAIPQTLAESKADLSGPYVKVLCSIYDENSGVRIWPKGEEHSYLYFPLNSPGSSNTSPAWSAGKAYAYNITIGVPATTGKIEFDVTVDEYPSFEDMYME